MAVKMKRKLSIDYLNFKIMKLSNEIISLTDQQAKHRQKIVNGCQDKHIKRFVLTVGGMIKNADKELQILIKQKEKLLNEKRK